ncbi:MAG TPA: DUF418 domain-containing protein YeiB [Arsenophonus apicola]|uniref:DUF418 domain-containing protein YeiB n=1 Tax=Arsenophonus apicola TaxID=2879119 RepID=UPI00387A0919
MFVITANWQRIEQIDLLRGSAILAILLVNIFGFALPQLAYVNPVYTAGTTAGDIWCWVYLHIFVQGKFLAIFSLLFGASLEFLSKQGLYWNQIRLFVLAIIGLIHGIGLWDGDILLPYALTGLLAIKIIYFNSLRQLYYKSIVIYLSGLIIFSSFSYFTDASSFWYFAENNFIEEINIKIAGGWQAFLYRAESVAQRLILLVIGYGWQLLALMIMGSALIRNGWLTGHFSLFHYRYVAYWLIPVTIIIQLFSIAIQYYYEWNYIATGLLGFVINQLIIPIQVAGYIAIIYGFWPQIKNIFIIRWLQSIGRMALTSYLLQTLICTTIFYRLGFFAQFSRIELLLFVPLIWLINILFAVCWLKYFTQGPIEWLWGYLTNKCAN